MKQIFALVQALSGALTLVLTLAACSGGGSRVPGQQCPKRFDPVAMNIDASRKAQLKPTALPDGSYELTKSMLFFKGDPTVTDLEGFQVLIKEEVPKKSKVSELQTVTDCFRNSKVTQAYGATVQGISALTIENGHASTTIKTFGFTMNEDNTFELQNAASDQKPSQPQDVFAKADETFVLTLGPGDYEIRSKGRGVNGTYYLSTFLHKTK